MKHYISGLLLVLLFAACNSKSDTTKDNTTSYLNQAVGTNVNDTYTITNLDTIKAEWEKSLQIKLNSASKVELKGFEIIEAQTEGDATADYYILHSRTDDGRTRVAALLELKGDKFYFDLNQLDNSEAYNIVICKGECDQGCLPIVRVQNEVKHLICSSCVDCEKFDGEMH
jgi:hypothetical protein